MLVVLPGKHLDGQLCPSQAAVAVFAKVSDNLLLGFCCGLALPTFFFLVAADCGLYACDSLVPERILWA